MVQKSIKNAFSRVKASAAKTIDKKDADLERKNPVNSEVKRNPRAFSQSDSEEVSILTFIDQ